ncbi:MAG: hypothetical protein ACK5AZ_07190 [Bryobacteraceae bacterium]
MNRDDLIFVSDDGGATVNSETGFFDLEGVLGWKRIDHGSPVLRGTDGERKLPDSNEPDGGGGNNPAGRVGDPEVQGGGVGERNVYNQQEREQAF